MWSGRNDQDGAIVEGAMASIAILIETPQGARLVAASSAREAALMAESVIAAVPRADLPVPVTVDCASPGMADRLVNYMADVQLELMLSEFV
jgi:hypothetical protein